MRQAHHPRQHPAPRRCASSSATAHGVASAHHTNSTPNHKPSSHFGRTRSSVRLRLTTGCHSLGIKPSDRTTGSQETNISLHPLRPPGWLLSGCAALHAGLSVVCPSACRPSTRVRTGRCPVLVSFVACDSHEVPLACCAGSTCPCEHLACYTTATACMSVGLGQLHGQGSQP